MVINESQSMTTESEPLITEIHETATGGPDHGAGAERSATEVRLRLLLEALPQGVVLLALDQTILAMNAAAVSLVSAPSLQHVLGRPFVSLVRSECRDALRLFLSTVTEGTPDPSGIRLETEARVPIQFKAVPFQTDGDHAPSILAVVQADPRTSNESPRPTEQRHATTRPAAASRPSKSSDASRKARLADLEYNLALVSRSEHEVEKWRQLVADPSAVEAAPSEAKTSQPVIATSSSADIMTPAANPPAPVANTTTLAANTTTAPRGVEPPLESPLTLVRAQDSAQVCLPQEPRSTAIRIDDIAPAVVTDLGRSIGRINELLDRLAAAGELSDTARHELESGRHAADRALKLARRFDLFRTDQMRAVESLSIDDAIRTLLPTLNQLVGRGTQVVLRLNAPEAIASVNREHLERALTGLVVEAREALPIGGIVTISTLESPGSGGSVRVAVAADGYAVRPLASNPALARTLAAGGGYVERAGSAPASCVTICLQRGLRAA
jgi:hypothetical protein